MGMTPRPKTSRHIAATWTILTPTTAPGAIAVILLTASDSAELELTLARLAIRAVGVGEARLRNLLGVDTGVVARWTGDTVHLMPHGGGGVVRALVRRLLEAGIPEQRDPDPRVLYPEANSEVEARMLLTLSRAASPLAIDLLLDQPRRWASGTGSDPALDGVLKRLVEPPLVVAVGPPNVGKSTLVNALAGRSVSIVADEPGTTRDHVGVLLDLNGLVVRYLDTPGVRRTSDPIEAAAQEIAERAAAAADLVLLLGDRSAPPPKKAEGGKPSLRVALRTDLGASSWPHDLSVSAATGAGLGELAARVLETLVPASARDDPRPWRFW